MPIGAYGDELRVHPHLPTCALHAALEQVCHVELLIDLAFRQQLLPEDERNPICPV
jgi:hypothetical protein